MTAVNDHPASPFKHLHQILDQLLASDDVGSRFACKLCQFESPEKTPARSHVLIDHFKDKNVELTFDEDKRVTSHSSSDLDRVSHLAKWKIGNDNVVLFSCRFCHLFKLCEDEVKKHLRQFHAVGIDKKDNKFSRKRLATTLLTDSSGYNARNAQVFTCRVCDFRDHLRNLTKHIATLHLGGRKNASFLRRGGKFFVVERHLVETDKSVIRWVIGAEATLYSCKKCGFTHERRTVTDDHVLVRRHGTAVTKRRASSTGGDSNMMAMVLNLLTETVTLDGRTSATRRCRLCHVEMGSGFSGTTSRRRTPSLRWHLKDFHLNGRNLTVERSGERFVELESSPDSDSVFPISRWEIGDYCTFFSCQTCHFTNDDEVLLKCHVLQHGRSSSSALLNSSSKDYLEKLIVEEVGEDEFVLVMRRANSKRKMLGSSSSSSETNGKVRSKKKGGGLKVKRLEKKEKSSSRKKPGTSGKDRSKKKKNKGTKRLEEVKLISEKKEGEDDEKDVKQEEIEEEEFDFVDVGQTAEEAEEVEKEEMCKVEPLEATLAAIVDSVGLKEEITVKWDPID